MTSAAMPDQRAVDVGPGVVAVLQEAGGLGVANASVVLRDGQAVIVDTMLLPQMAAGIHAVLAERNASARLVINTHHHMDHIGGNRTFPGVPVVAVPQTAGFIGGMAADGAFLPAVMPAFAAEIGEISLRVPDGVPAADMPVAIPGATVLAFQDAHTPADLALWLEPEAVLLAGDLCSAGIVPLALHGDAAGWVTALDQLIALRPETIVPGHGPVCGPAELAAVRQYLAAIVSLARRGHEAGAQVDDLLPELDPGPVGDWREPARTRMNLAAALRRAAGHKPEPLSRPPATPAAVSGPAA
jgi:cyclase